MYAYSQCGDKDFYVHTQMQPMVKMITAAAREGWYVAFGDCTNAVVQSARRTDETICTEPPPKADPPEESAAWSQSGPIAWGSLFFGSVQQWHSLVSNVDARLHVKASRHVRATIHMNVTIFAGPRQAHASLGFTSNTRGGFSAGDESRRICRPNRPTNPWLSAGTFGHGKLQRG